MYKGSIGMCVFCASIPAVMALGVSAKTKQNQAQKKAEAVGEPRPRPVLPAGPTTALAVAALVTASVVVHTHLAG